MFENAFGYQVEAPANIRIVFMWLCQDVASLQSKWDFYMELYGKEENTELLSALAPWSFNIIEESLRDDMTMAICRLSDPPVSGRDQENLSLETLVKRCTDIPNLDMQLKSFKEACKPLRIWRHKRVGHNDLNTKISPKENPLPGINKNQIDQILTLAKGFLNTISFRYAGGQLVFHTISRGGAEELIFWLKAGREHHSRDEE